MATERWKWADTRLAVLGGMLAISGGMLVGPWHPVRLLIGWFVTYLGAFLLGHLHGRSQHE